MLITDAQVHVWPPETPERPWPPANERVPTQGPPFSYEELRVRMDEAGVDRAILVPPSFEGDRNDFCLAGYAAYPDRFRVMGRLDMADPAGAAAVARWRETPGLLGVRLTFGFGKTANWLRDGTCEWFWDAAEQAGVPVMLFPPGFLPEVADVARRHPGLRLVIDHLGIHAKKRDEPLDAKLDELCTLAKYDNVAVKATCVPSLVSEPYPFPSLHDRLRRVVDAFGPRRVFWGSDLTRLPCTYSEAVTMFTEELAFLDGEDLELVMGKAICDWLGWE